MKQFVTLRCCHQRNFTVSSFQFSFHHFYEIQQLLLAIVCYRRIILTLFQTISQLENKKTTEKFRIDNRLWQGHEKRAKVFFFNHFFPPIWSYYYKPFEQLNILIIHSSKTYIVLLLLHLLIKTPERRGLKAGFPSIFVFL